MSQVPVGRLGDSAAGVCSCHDDPINVSGTITSVNHGKNSTAEGVLIAVHGATCTFSCGHTGVVAASGSGTIEGKKMVRLGDPTSGCVVGTITAASSTCTSG